VKTLILFDAETQHYRQSIYGYFQEEFAKHGYRLKVAYDRKLNDVQGDLFTAIDFSYRGLASLIRSEDCRLVILFVWLRYKFLLPLMLANRLKGIRMVCWSHGINLQKKQQVLVKQLYYVRQWLADALIMFSEGERKHIRASQRKLFVANNTLTFRDFPVIPQSREELKTRYGFPDEKVVLCVGRLNTNNRKPDYLIEGFSNAAPAGCRLLLVGPGLTAGQAERARAAKNIEYLGPVYDPVRINEIFKLADVFCMPGEIGLAINQAFYHGLPVVVEELRQSPEAGYLHDGRNGFFFKAGDVADMMAKISTLCRDEALRLRFSDQARDTILREASVENMFSHFLEAVRYAER